MKIKTKEWLYSAWDNVCIEINIDFTKGFIRNAGDNSVFEKNFNDNRLIYKSITDISEINMCHI